MTKCNGVTLKGKGCTKDTLDNELFCIWHHPDTLKCGQEKRNGGTCSIPAHFCRYHTRPLRTDPKNFRVRSLRSDKGAPVRG